jgi:hypothetical protein
MPPQLIIMGMPIAIIEFMALQRSVIMSMSMPPSIGIMVMTMPCLVIVQVMRAIIGIDIGIIIGMPIPIIIGFMPPIIIGFMPPIIMGFIMPFIIGMPMPIIGFIMPFIGMPMPIIMGFIMPFIIPIIMGFIGIDMFCIIGIACIVRSLFEAVKLVSRRYLPRCGEAMLWLASSAFSSATTDGARELTEMPSV